MDVLTFEVDRQRFAVAVTDVLEILRAVAIVPLPKAPLVVQGVIDRRGELVAVLDLRRRFGATRRPLHPDEHFIVLRAGTRTIALRVDRADAVVRVDDALVRPVADVVQRAEYVSGLATLPDGVVLIADALAFLTAAESAALDELLAGDARVPASVSA